MTIYDVLIDFSLAGLLMLVGMYLRTRLRFFQRNFVPASLLAGFLGLILGPNMLDILPFSTGISTYSGALVIVVFASVGLNGFSFSKDDVKRDIRRVGSLASYKLLSLSLQISIPIIVSLLIISKLSPDINEGFGIILGAGFYGGHGTAAAIGESFTKLGWVDGQDLAMTSATIGMLVGIFGGLMAIKWGVKNGYTKYIENFDQIDEEQRTGLIEPENRKPIALGTISQVAIDPVAFHIALLLIPSGLGYIISNFISKNVGLQLPTFTVSFLVALFMFFTLGKGENKLYKYVDSEIITRLGSATTDFLVFFGVASIKITVIIKYALPFSLLILTGLALVFFVLRYLGPRMNYENWFERSIFVYGYSTGVFAVGLTLLRIVDPNNKSKTLSDVAIVESINTIFEMLAWTLGPIMLLNGSHWQFVGMFLLVSIVCLGINISFKWWYASEPLKGRPDVE